ncbi:MAG: hypothetical protein AAF745_02730 [Planctomycetota bacterium]
MVSRTIIAAALTLVTWCHFATAQNFVTYSTQHPDKAQAIVNRAEQCRQDIAKAWFATEIPPWGQPCRIQWRIDKTRGSGVTSYQRDQFSQLLNMEMQIRGSWDRLMNDVIPHEVMHLVLHDRVGFALPRWMDEGAASTTESDDSIELMERKLIKFLREGRVPPINVMLLATEYPDDVLPFYAQGVSLSRWLIAKRGPDAFLDLARVHRQTGSWTESFRQVYGYRDLRKVQADWMRWVQAGCPDIPRDRKSALKPIPQSQAPYRPMQQVMKDRKMQLWTPAAAAGQLTGNVCPPRDTMPSAAAGVGASPGQPTIRVQVEYEKLAEELSKFPSVKGADGRDGRNGVDGKDGKDGQNGLPGPPGEPGRVTPEQIESIVAAVSKEIPNEDAIVRKVVEILKRDNLVCKCPDDSVSPGSGDGEPPLPPLPDDGEPGAGNGDSATVGDPKPQRVLYFTSAGCTNCEPLDNAVERYKRNGFPITIITLRERDTEVYRVPQIFVPDTEQRAVGWQEVNAFLYEYLEGGSRKP